jgi:hypothetical protein
LLRALWLVVKTIAIIDRLFPLKHLFPDKATNFKPKVMKTDWNDDLTFRFDEEETELAHTGADICPPYKGKIRFQASSSSSELLSFHQANMCVRCGNPSLTKAKQTSG